jgi:hypothetical protein
MKIALNTDVLAAHSRSPIPYSKPATVSRNAPNAVEKIAVVFISVMALFHLQGHGHAYYSGT